MQCGNNLLKQLKYARSRIAMPIHACLDSAPNISFGFAACNSINNSRNDFINVFLQGESFNFFENLVMVINS